MFYIFYWGVQIAYCWYCIEVPSIVEYNIKNFASLRTQNILSFFFSQYHHMYRKYIYGIIYAAC